MIYVGGVKLRDGEDGRLMGTMIGFFFCLFITTVLLYMYVHMHQTQEEV